MDPAIDPKAEEVLEHKNDEEGEEKKQVPDAVLSPNTFAIKRVDSKVMKLQEQWQSTQTRVCIRVF